MASESTNPTGAPPPNGGDMSMFNWLSKSSRTKDASSGAIIASESWQASGPSEGKRCPNAHKPTRDESEALFKSVRIAVCIMPMRFFLRMFFEVS